MRVAETFFAGMVVAYGMTVPSLTAAQDFSADPVRAFAGCDTDARASSETAATPRDRVERQHEAPKVDKVTQRSFASLSLEDVEAGVPKEMASLCWARLDGVWKAETPIALDRSREDAGLWGSDAPELIALANGTYTTPRFIVIDQPTEPESKLSVASGLTGERFVEFRSANDVTLKDVLRRGGATKTYTTADPFDYGQKMEISVTRTGRVRLSLDGRPYIRPQPGVSKATLERQLASDDAFLLSYNLENVAASRRGYDVITQDPFFLLENPKSEVFAKVDPKNYYITEKRTVPVGFSLVQENSQGMVYRKSLVSTERQIQKTMESSFGAKVGGSFDVGPAGAGSSVAFDVARSTMESLTQSKSVAMAVGYSRSKQYALIVDHPYVTLSSAFIDAVDDARRYGRYQDLINTFGTHYAYAVTYGAAAKVTESYTEETYAQLVRRSWKAAINTSTRGKMPAGPIGIGVEAELRVRLASATAKGQAGTTEDSRTSFVAVGGNASWDQGAFSAGNTPYPVLLDLRPLYELLDPMNFPGEPEVYTDVRQRLQQETARYLERPPLSDVSLLPKVVPEAAPELRRPVAVGGGGGGAWAFDSEEAVEQGHVSEVRICHGKYIDSIQLSYAGEPGHQFGGPGGSCHSWAVPAGEFVTRVLVRHGRFVDALQFVTDKGRRSAFYGGPGGTLDTIDAGPGAALRTINAKAGRFVDGLRFEFRPVNDQDRRPQ